MIFPKAHILVIEDEESNRSSLVDILESEGFAVSAAENGAAALELTNKWIFDVLLVDYNLPDVNGIDIIRQILKVSKESVPVIITGSSSLETALEGMRIGVHDYLVKPVDPGELLSIIKTILREREEFRRAKDTFHSSIQDLKKGDPGAIVNVVTGESFDFKDDGSTPFLTRMLEAVKTYFR